MRRVRRHKQSCVYKHIDTQTHEKFSQAQRRDLFTNSTNLIPSRQTALTDVLNVSLAVTGDDRNLSKLFFSRRGCVSPPSSPSEPFLCVLAPSSPLSLLFFFALWQSISYRERKTKQNTTKNKKNTACFIVFLQAGLQSRSRGLVCLLLLQTLGPEHPTEPPSLSGLNNEKQPLQTAPQAAFRTT